MTQDALIVKTLGRFSVKWQQTYIIGGNSMNESQFVYLMQLLLHAGERGVSRLELEETLFGDREIQNRHHALQAVLYNAGKKLKQAGLPDCVFFRREQGIFYWTDQIPVLEDAALFEQACSEAMLCNDPSLRMEKMTRACYLYTGEFLTPFSASILWASQEAQRYYTLFCKIVQETAHMMQQNQNYQHLVSLGEYVSRIDPGSCWEELIMEGLYKMGQYEKAREFFDRTSSRYFREWGIQPSKRMISLMNRISGKLSCGSIQATAIGDLLSNLGKNRPESRLYSFQTFQGAFLMAKKMSAGNGCRMQLLLCSLTQLANDPKAANADRLEKMMDELAIEINRSLQDSDIFTRYSENVFLLLLLRKNEGEFSAVPEQINRLFCHYTNSCKLSFSGAIIPPEE